MIIQILKIVNSIGLISKKGSILHVLFVVFSFLLVSGNFNFVNGQQDSIADNSRQFLPLENIPKKIKLLSDVYHVSVHQTNNEIIVGHSYSISILDGNTHEILRTQTLQDGVYSERRNMALNENTNKIYGVHGGYIRAIDIPTLNSHKIDVGSWPKGIAINPATNKIYVINTGADSLSIIDGFTNSEITKIRGIDGDTGIAINSQTNKVYVGEFPNRVTVIDGNSNEIIKVISLAQIRSPSNIAIDEVNNLIFVSGYEDTIEVINGNTDIVSFPIDAKSGLKKILMNPLNNNYFISNYNTGTIDYLDNDGGKKILNLSGVIYFDFNKNTNLLYAVSDNQLYFFESLPSSVDDNSVFILENNDLTQSEDDVISIPTKDESEKSPVSNDNDLSKQNSSILDPIQIIGIFVGIISLILIVGVLSKRKKSVKYYPPNIEPKPVMPKSKPILPKPDDIETFHVDSSRKNSPQSISSNPPIPNVSKIENSSKQEPSKPTLPKFETSNNSNENKKWDVFISHASEDKESVAKPFAEKLQKLGLNVWYDEFNLKWGTSLRKSIDEGLSNSLFGVVILSEKFFQKHWTQIELDGLTTIMTTTGKDNILPLRYDISHKRVAAISPILAGIFSRSWDEGIENLANEVKKLVEERKK